MKSTPIPHLSRIKVRTRDFFKCFRCGCPTPAGAGQWHHRRSRSVRDQHQHCTCNGIWLCATCHGWVHAHPLEARVWGWIVSRYAVPLTSVAFGQQHGWVLLTCDGRTLPGSDPREQ